MLAFLIKFVALTRQMGGSMAHITMCCACALEVTGKGRELLADVMDVAMLFALGPASWIWFQDPLTLLQHPLLTAGVIKKVWDIFIHSALAIDVALSAIEHAKKTWPNRKS